eukprot:12037233-Ditylum_brightwellii.AAC.1
MLAAQELLAMSATVLVVDQKRGALSMYPIGALRWNPMRGSASVGSNGITKARADDVAEQTLESVSELHGLRRCMQINIVVDTAEGRGWVDGCGDRSAVTADVIDQPCGRMESL